MSDFIYSAVLICPAASQDKANRLSCALGHDVLPGKTFTAGLSADGSEPATHYGCRAIAKQDFVDLFAGAAQGVLPDLPWADYGLTVEDVQSLLGALVADFRGSSDGAGHFDDVATANGLARL